MKLSKSPWILHYDGSSCNGCDIEVLASMMPHFDVERFGVINTGNPKHADILLLTGSINAQTEPVVRQLYKQMPDPKVVMACGVCACDGGIFKECYNVKGGADQVIPVDIYVPGCAVRPEALIEGVKKAVALLDKKREDMKIAMKKGYCTVDYGRLAVHTTEEDYSKNEEEEQELTDLVKAEERQEAEQQKEQQTEPEKEPEADQKKEQDAEQQKEQDSAEEKKQ